MGGTNHLNLGAFCRLDVPRIVRDRDLAAEMASRGLGADTVLYTDTDVLFAADFEEVRQPPRTFSAATEVFSPSMNSGVMVMSASQSVFTQPLAWSIGPVGRAHHPRCMDIGPLCRAHHPR